MLQSYSSSIDAAAFVGLGAPRVGSIIAAPKFVRRLTITSLSLFSPLSVTISAPYLHHHHCLGLTSRLLSNATAFSCECRPSSHASNSTKWIAVPTADCSSQLSPAGAVNLATHWIRSTAAAAANTFKPTTCSLSSTSALSIYSPGGLSTPTCLTSRPTHKSRFSRPSFSS